MRIRLAFTEPMIKNVIVTHKLLLTQMSDFFLKSLLPTVSDTNNLPFDGVTGPYEENLQTERAQRK